MLIRGYYIVSDILVYLIQQICEFLYSTTKTDHHDITEALY
jgi:hypothetical protein